MGELMGLTDFVIFENYWISILEAWFDAGECVESILRVGEIDFAGRVALIRLIATHSAVHVYV